MSSETSDSDFITWKNAPRPKYDEVNTDLEYPYSEYPRKYEYEYQSYLLPKNQSSSRILDFWGEGRITDGGTITGFPSAYNVNYQFQLVSSGSAKGAKIPNRIPTLDKNSVSVQKYVPEKSFHIITLIKRPELPEATAAEIARIISGEQTAIIVMYGFIEGQNETAQMKAALNTKQIYLLPHYELPSPLNEVTLQPALAFRPKDVVLGQAKQYFFDDEMEKCGDVLCSLYSSLKEQPSAKEVLESFFADEAIKNSYMIFALGYELDGRREEGKQVLEEYMNGNVVKIVQASYTSIEIQSNIGEPAYLCPNDPVSKFEWAFFGTMSYIDAKKRYKGGEKLRLVPQTIRYNFQIECSFGSQSFLCVNHPVTSEYQRAFFGIPSYLESPTYHDGQYFRLHPVSGGEYFKVQASFGEPSYLFVEGQVSADSYQWAYFGTAGYIDRKYSGCQYFKVIFQ